MRREIYLATVEEQIHCKKARAMVRREMERHIDDQKDSYLEQGLTETEAETLAVQEMGDPVEAGKDLNRIHRMKLDWKLPVLAIVLSIFGLLAQHLAFSEMAQLHAGDYMAKSLVCSLIGILVMAGLMFLDYRFLINHIWQIYVIYLGVMWTAGMGLGWYGGGNEIRGIGREVIWMLFLPLFLSFLYRFRQEGTLGLVKLLGILAFQSVIMDGICSPFYVVIAICVFMMFLAVGKRLFGGSRPIQGTLLTGIFIGIPMAVVAAEILGMESSYFGKKMLSFMMPEHFSDSLGYQFLQAKSQIAQVSLQGSRSVGVFSGTEESYTEYILTGAVSWMGWGVAMILLIVLAVFLMRMLRISMMQRHTFGFLLGMGISSLFLLKAICYVGKNLGILSSIIYTDMPFVSYGPHSSILNFVLLGLLLSVYRHTMVVDEEYKKEVRYRLELRVIDV